MNCNRQLMPSFSFYQFIGFLLWVCVVTPNTFARDTGERIELWPGGNIQSRAAITLHRPAKPNGTAVVICPGGGYGMLVAGPEGHGVAKWLNENGITGIVLEYELPRGRSQVPLADAQQALRLVRANAKAWSVDPQRVGIMGFSAGGHLASTAGTHYRPKAAVDSEAAVDAAGIPLSSNSCRPDFMVLIYPVITMGGQTHQGSRRNLLGSNPSSQLIIEFSNEQQVTSDTPPAFLVHAKDDHVVVPGNSEMFHAALKKHGVDTHYLELPSGGHGLNGYQGPMWTAWQTGLLNWLADQKMVPAVNDIANEQSGKDD
ncbi:MAG: alpha/beta hydrolase [Rubripirellula sp.]